MSYVIVSAGIGEGKSGPGFWCEGTDSTFSVKAPQGAAI